MNLDMILRTLNIPYDTRESGSRSIYRVDCPYCHRSLKHKDYSGALFYTEDTISYSCFRGCKPVSGGAFRVLSDISGFTLKEVSEVVKEYSFGRIKTTPIAVASTLHKPVNIGLDSSYSEYLSSRGFVPELVSDKYSLIFTPHTPYFYNNKTVDKPIPMQNRVVFPIYNDLGVFVGFTGRSIDRFTLNRYIFPKREWTSVDPKDIGFGLRHKKDTVVIVEGAVDACKMPQSLACLGIKYSSAFVNYVISHYKRAIVMFDPNESRARIAQNKLTRELSMLMDVEQYKYPYDWDIGDCTKSEIEKICSDIGVDVDTEHLNKEWKRC